MVQQHRNFYMKWFPYLSITYRIARSALSSRSFFHFLAYSDGALICQRRVNSDGSLFTKLEKSAEKDNRTFMNIQELGQRITVIQSKVRRLSEAISCIGLPQETPLLRQQCASQIVELKKQIAVRIWEISMWLCLA